MIIVNLNNNIMILYEEFDLSANGLLKPLQIIFFKYPFQHIQPFPEIELEPRAQTPVDRIFYNMHILGRGVTLSQ
jgi:hypothetical protein